MVKIVHIIFEILVYFYLLVACVCRMSKIPQLDAETETVMKQVTVTCLCQILKLLLNTVLAVPLVQSKGIIDGTVSVFH